MLFFFEVMVAKRCSHNKHFMTITINEEVMNIVLYARTEVGERRERGHRSVAASRLRACVCVKGEHFEQLLKYSFSSNRSNFSVSLSSLYVLRPTFHFEFKEHIHGIPLQFTKTTNLSFTREHTSRLCGCLGPRASVGKIITCGLSKHS